MTPAPSSARTRRGRIGRLLLLCFAGACLIGLLGRVFAQEIKLQNGLLVDDAYITLRHAQQLVRGNGLNYNAGERIEGYTSFSHTVLMALVIALDLDPVGWAKGLGVAATIALLIACYQLWRELFGIGAALGLSAALAFDPRIATMSVWGLESTLYMALLTAAWLASVRQRPVLSGVLFALAALTRMEAVLQVAIATLAAAFTSSSAQRSPLAQPEASNPQATHALRDRMRRALRLALPFALLFGPYYIARYAYYGFPLPNTFYAKVGAPGSAFARGLKYLADCNHNMGIGWALALSAALALPAIALGLGKSARYRVDRLAVAAGAFVHLSYVVLVGGDFFLERLLYHGLPLLLAVVVWPVVALAERFAFTSLRHLISGAFAAALALSLARSPERFGGSAGVAGFAALGHALAWVVPKDSTLATGAAGALPYYSELYTIDALGLCNVHIAHHPVPMGKGMVGHERHDPAYVLSRKPDYIASWLDRQGRSTEYPGGPPGYRLAAVVDMWPTFISSSVVLPITEGHSYGETLATLGVDPHRFEYGLFERLPIQRWALSQTPTQHAAATPEPAHSELRLATGLLPKGRYRTTLHLRLASADEAVAAAHGSAGICRLQLLHGTTARQDTLLPNPVPVAGAIQTGLWFDVRAPDRDYALRVYCSGSRTVTLDHATLDRVR